VEKYAWKKHYTALATLTDRSDRSYIENPDEGRDCIMLFGRTTSNVVEMLIEAGETFGFKCSLPFNIAKNVFAYNFVTLTWNSAQ